MASAQPKLPMISVLGAGYVGLTTAVLFAEAGFKVYLVELNPKRLKVILGGKSFFYEEGLDPLIKHALKTGALLPTHSYADAIPKSRFIFSCVGTPDNPDGSSNLSYVFAAAQETIRYMGDGAIFVQKSTVPVGTGQRIEASFAETDKDIKYVSNPEFLREGTAISDTLWFDRIVAGSEDEQAAKGVLDLYRTLQENRLKIAKRADIESGSNHDGLYVSTSLASAELIKVTANAFLALKISFANSIAKLADKADADVNQVMDAVGADQRIGRAFLNAGRGYGGGCFPKDVTGLIKSAEDHGVDLPIMVAASNVNDSMPGYIVDKASKVLGTLKDKRIAVLGLSFKAGTSDARRSPGVKIANILQEYGAVVSVYDPKATKEASEDLKPGISIADTAIDAIKKSEAVFFTTDWPDFLKLDMKELKSLMRGKLIVDGMNKLDEEKIINSGLHYVGVGRY